MGYEIGEVVLSVEDVRAGVERVAAALNARYREVDVITVVPGGVLFTADLVRRLDADVRMDYISCPHTPGERTNASPIVFGDNLGIAGRDVIVVDDAIESGGTMKRLVEHLRGFGPASLATATLFVKPGRVDVGAEQFYGHELTTDELLVGYGLPWEHRHRNLPHVARLNPDADAR